MKYAIIGLVIVAIIVTFLVYMSKKVPKLTVIKNPVQTDEYDIQFGDTKFHYSIGDQTTSKALNGYTVIVQTPQDQTRNAINITVTKGSKTISSNLY